MNKITNPGSETPEDLSRWDLTEFSEDFDDMGSEDWDQLLADYPAESSRNADKMTSQKLAAVSGKKLSKKESENRKFVFPAVKPAFPRLSIKVLVCCAAALLALVLCVAGGILIGRAMDPYDSQILPNTTIGGIPVGGMTKSEARKALKEVTDTTFSQKDMAVILPDGTVTLAAKETTPKLDIRAAVSSAYAHGRKGTAEEIQAAVDASQGQGFNVDLLPHLKLDQAYIRSQLEAYATQHNVAHTEMSYQLSGQQPALEENLYDSDAPGQTLELTLGTGQTELDVDAVLKEILNAYSFNQFSVTIDSIAPKTTPKAPDLDALYEEFYIPPVNTSLDMTTFQQIPGSYGYQLDMEAAKKLLANAHDGETISIPMTFVKPEILGDEVYFRDELAYCETPHSNNANRAINLKLACAALDGLILQPGEEFSYNNTLGERTKERGYKPAPAYSGYTLVDSLGGGICQVSSTLYCATLYADLEIIFRVNHGFKSNYIGLGLDATVSWGRPDFQFRNNFNFPVMLKAETTDTHVKIRILGTDEKDYYIEMTSGYSEDEANIYCWTYKNKYDKQTKELISKEREAYSRYSK